MSGVCGPDSVAEVKPGRVLPDDKPNSVMVVAKTWFCKHEMVLPDGEASAETLEIRKLIGRGKVPYPMPVGKWSVYKSKSWKPKTDDVIVLTFHKTGTTFCQQICHQLRTGAPADGSSTKFDEITQVCPWIDFAWEVDQDLNADQVASPGMQVATPRIFKSHARLNVVQEGCKYLVTIRDPVKSLVSLYNFFVQKNAAVPFLPPQWLTSVDEFVKCPVWMIDSVWGGTIWEYFIDFWLCRKQPSVLVLAFEDLMDDPKEAAGPPAKELKKIAAFMGVECDDALVGRVKELSHKKWMEVNDSKFSEGWFYDEQCRLERYDRPPLPPVAKVTSGAAKVVPSEETVKLMQAQWEELVTPKLGFKTYAEMLAALREENNAN